MDEQKLACASIAATVALIAVAIAAVMIVNPAEAVEIEPDWTWKVAPSDITNCKALREMRLEKLKAKLDAAVEEWRAEKEAEEQAAWEAAYYYEPTYYAPSYSGVQGDPDGLNSFVGVIEYDGRRETAYSSQVLYHYRTSEWTPDAQGFYHDADGRYVVAASDMEMGTVFEGSMGECIVLDTGCDAGVTDYYVNWG